ncbi:MAG: dihydroneopterin aldolase [Gaiellaceae bacterium]
MSEVLIEVRGLELRGFHGALEEERLTGQRFVFDVELLTHDAGVRSDELADTVDYTAVVARIEAINGDQRFNLIEALAAAVADDLLERFPAARVRVRVRKPEVRLSAPAEYTAATVERVRR